MIYMARTKVVNCPQTFGALRTCWILIGIILMCTSMIGGLKYEKKAHGLNQELTGYILDTVNVDIQFHCAALCEEQQCELMHYNSGSTLCTLYSVYMSDGTATLEGLYALSGAPDRKSCSPLTSTPTHATKSSTGTGYGNTTTYQCDTGYSISSGDQVRTCSGGGVWNGTKPTCDILDCGTLSHPSNGQVSLPSGTTYGATASYTCDNSYSLSGSETKTCQSNGQWDGQTTTCDLIDCGALSIPADGGRTYSSGTIYNSRATLTCNTGYTMAGSSSRICQANGNWDGSPTTCSIVDCGDLPIPGDGQRSYTSGTVYNSVASFSCNTGYTLSGSQSRTCWASASWSGQPASCSIVDCGSLSAPTNGGVSYSAGTTYNSMATLSCDTGYTLSGSSKRTCQANGDWDGSTTTCTIVDCGNLVHPDDGQVTSPGGTTFGAVATYTCNQGYTLIGSVTRTCEATGSWSGQTTTCDIVDCGSLTEPTHGQISYGSAGTTYNAIATFSCNTGYNLVGHSSRFCTADGIWAYSNPSCNIVDCGALSIPANCQLTQTSGTTYISQTTYVCDTGYTLSGSSTRTCQASGLWSNTAPTCQIVDCGALGNPTGGAVSYSSTTYNSVATYTCNAGFDLSGSNSRVCQSNTQWSNTSPSCNPFNPTCDSFVDPGYTNVATSSTVTVSSQFNSGSNPNLVKDGSWGGNGPFASTQLNTNPWMKLTLTQAYTIYGVRIINRSDCCQTSLQNIKVFGYMGSAETLRATYDPAITSQCYFNYNGENTFSADAIRVQQTNNGYMTVDEIQIYGA